MTDLRRTLAERDAEIARLRAERDHLRSWVLAAACDRGGLMALLAPGAVRTGSDENGRPMSPEVA